MFVGDIELELPDNFFLSWTYLVQLYLPNPFQTLNV